MAIKYANNASTTLTSISTNGLDIVVGAANVFPDFTLASGDSTYVTLSTADGSANTIVKIVTINGTALTAASAVSWTVASGDLCELRLTKELLEDTVDDLAPSTLATVAIVETVNTYNTSGASVNYIPDLSTGTIFRIDQDVTIEMPSTTVNGTTTIAEYEGKSFTVIEKNGVTVSWSTTIPITWSGDSAVPSRTARTIYSFLCDGVKWYGMEVGNGFGST
jgi:hypothetical protein